MSALASADLRDLAPLNDGLSADYLEHNAVLPVRIEDGQVLVATWRDALEDRVLDDLRLMLAAEPVPVQLPEDDIRAAIRRVYGGEATTAEALIEGMASDGVGPASGRVAGAPAGTANVADVALDDLVSQANEAPVVRLVNMLLLEALDARASDVHLEQHATGLDVRYRIDGVLQGAPLPPRQHASAVVSRLKIMAELDIAERRLPQDGRIRLRLKERDVDVRVSTIPTLHGESVVLRLLDKKEGRIGLEELGMAPDTLSAFSEVIARPNGIVLATGPTGSGKTTTLYAALDRVKTGREKVLTVEDPVEYELAGVAQVPVNTRVGLTFARALRALLRQDPDILLVGEIRDPETAEIATHAALTGHLVLSTLHTNNAASALTRLLDLGLDSYLVASTVEAVLAQRLLRRVCDACARERPITTEELHAFGGSASASDGVTAPQRFPDVVREGTGCEACRNTGFVGRTGIYELLRISERIRAEIYRRSGSGIIGRLATEAGMRTLRGDGLRLVAEGVTTPAEVLRVVV
ncbi:MAG TPA: GspE/PulE family protein [Longimicrobiales bacterium]|nr:GspE/PulE family protein [Longimicrobiales bacterium]